jgi:hypothetical protein
MALPIDHSQKISQLLSHAEKETFSHWKFDGYYKAAKLQIQSGLTSEARVSYIKADEVRRKDSSLGILKNILKLVKLSLLINPDQRPALLSVAEQKMSHQKSWVERIGGKSVLGNKCIACFTKLAVCFYRLKECSKADQYLTNAIEWLESDSSAECLKAYKQIVKICVLQNKKHQFQLITPRIEAQLQKLPRYLDSNICLLWCLEMADLAYKIDRDWGKKMLTSASQFMVSNSQNLLDCNIFFDLQKKHKFLQQMMK